MNAAPAGAAPLSAATPFSYACHRCRRCCHDKLIQVNPYEAARLARHLGLTTTAFIAAHLERGTYLRRRPDGACVFLGPDGCTVHADRPLVCRLYPLGRHVGPDGAVTYSHLTPHPETAGVYGRDGTISDYLAGQEVEDFTAAADRYLSILQRLFDAWRQAPPPAASGGTPADEPELLDLDRAVEAHCTARRIPEPTDLEARLQLHVAAIVQWLEAGPPEA